MSAPAAFRALTRGAARAATPSMRAAPRTVLPAVTTTIRGIKTTSPTPIQQTAAPAASTAAPAAERAEKVLGSPHRLPEFSLDKKVVLISGGTGGVGMQQAEALMEAGAIVYLLDRQPAEKLRDEFFALQEKAQRELGTKLDYRQADVRNQAELHQIVKDIADIHGRMDGLIAAAGINKELTAFEHTAKDFEDILAVNVTGAFLCAQAVGKQMMRFGKGGSIALIGSMSGTIANRGLDCAAYNASKAAVLQLARNLAMEWGRHGVRVNTISPGYIATDMVHHLLDEVPERRTNWPRDNMLGRLSRPQEFRGAAVFLLSDASSYMTGADLIIDGGHHSW